MIRFISPTLLERLSWCIHYAGKQCKVLWLTDLEYTVVARQVARDWLMKMINTAQYQHMIRTPKDLGPSSTALTCRSWDHRYHNRPVPILQCYPGSNTATLGQGLLLQNHPLRGLKHHHHSQNDYIRCSHKDLSPSFPLTSAVQQLNSPNASKYPNLNIQSLPPCSAFSLP